VELTNEGCNWHSFESDSNTRQAQWDRTTFNRLADLSKRQPELCKRIPFFTVWSDPERASKIWFQELVGDVREPPHSEMLQLIKQYKSITDKTGQLPGGKPFGHSFSSYIINAPNYLAYLGQTVRDMGIPIHRTRLASLDSAFDLKDTGKVPLVVNATGLGARTMIGVEDPSVYPARGQTVLVRAPEVSRCIMHVEGFMAAAPRDGEGEPLFLSDQLVTDQYRTSTRTRIHYPSSWS
jgi:D-amino-acid oxidase